MNPLYAGKILKNHKLIILHHKTFHHSLKDISVLSTHEMATVGF